MAMLRSEREHQRWLAERKDKKDVGWEARKAEFSSRYNNPAVGSPEHLRRADETAKQKQQVIDRNKFNETKWATQDANRMQNAANVSIANREQLGQTRRDAMKYGFENRKLSIEQNKNRDALFNSLFNKASGMNEKGEPIGELVTGEARNKAFSNLKDQYEAFGQKTMGASTYWMPGSPQQQAQPMGQQQPVIQSGPVNAMGSQPQQLMRAPSMQSTGRGLINGVPEDRAMADFESKFGKNGDLSSLNGDSRKAEGRNWLGDRGGLQGRVQGDKKATGVKSNIGSYLDRPNMVEDPDVKANMDYINKLTGSAKQAVSKGQIPAKKKDSVSVRAIKNADEKIKNIPTALKKEGRKIKEGLSDFTFFNKPKPATTTKAFEKNLSKLRNKYPGVGKKELLKIFQRNNK